MFVKIFLKNKNHTNIDLSFYFKKLNYIKHIFFTLNIFSSQNEMKFTFGFLKYKEQEAHFHSSSESSSKAF